MQQNKPMNKFKRAPTIVALEVHGNSSFTVLSGARHPIGIFFQLHRYRLLKFTAVGNIFNFLHSNARVKGTHCRTAITRISGSRTVPEMFVRLSIYLSNCVLILLVQQ